MTRFCLRSLAGTLAFQRLLSADVDFDRLRLCFRFLGQDNLQDALVAFGQMPERPLSGWVQPIWKKIGTRRIGIYSLPCALPRQAAQAGILNAAVVDNERAVAAAWQGYEGQVLALRPDRYVMGAFPASDPGSAALAQTNGPLWQVLAEVDA